MDKNSDAVPFLIFADSWHHRTDITPSRVLTDSWHQNTDITPSHMLAHSWHHNTDITPSRMLAHSWHHTLPHARSQLTSHPPACSITADITPSRMLAHSWHHNTDIKDLADVNNYRPIAIATALSKVLEQVLLSPLARYLWTAGSQFGFKRAHETEMAIFVLKKTVDFYRNQDTPVSCALLMHKSHLIELIIGPKQRKCWTEMCHCIFVKLFIFWYRVQEFMVRWGNSLSMTFLCSNGIREGGQLFHLLYNVYIQMT